MTNPHRWRCDCHFLNPDWTADKIEAVRAKDYDALAAQLSAARELLRWAVAFVESAAAAELGAHQGVCVAFDVNASISYARARDWIARARRAI